MDGHPVERSARSDLLRLRLSYWLSECSNVTKGRIRRSLHGRWSLRVEGAQRANETHGLTRLFGFTDSCTLVGHERSESLSKHPAALRLLWWDWHVAGRTDRSDLQDHLTVLGPCIVRGPWRFGVQRPGRIGFELVLVPLIADREVECT